MDYGALVQVAVGLIGELLAADKKDEAQALLTQMRVQFQGIPLPDLKDIEAVQLGPSAMEGVKTDPTLEASQYDALNQLKDIISGNGLSAIDAAQINTDANQVARRQRAGMAGIESDMAARGQAGSGMDYGIRAGMASDANQRLSEAGQNVQAQGLQRRLQAIGQTGEMAGKMRGQAWDERSAKAQAADTVARLNAAARSQAQYHNANLPQQRFANQMQKTGAMANPTNALAANYNNNANDTRNAFGYYGAAAGKFVDSATEDDDKKKDK